MLKNYLAIAIRNIRQNKLYAFINIFSLAIGLAACIVIYLFISDEKSFDDFHSNKDHIYRLDEVQSFPGTNEQKVALTMPGMGPALLRDFPEVKSYVRLWTRGQQLVMRGDTRILVDKVFVVDSTFFQFFDFPLLQGDRATALNEPNTLLVTEKTAKKFFPSVSEAMNNTLTWDGKEFKITGILKDCPENTHIKYEMLISLPTVTSTNKEFNNRWGGNFMQTYLWLQPNTDIKAMESKFPKFLSSHMDNPDINKFYKMYLQKLSDVHLGSIDIEHDYVNYRKFNGEYLDLFYIIGGFILLIAGVNFMNVTTARASHRWKEIGVRKTIGAKKLQLFSQFIFESLLLAVMALVLAFLLDITLIPLLNKIIGRQLSLLTLLQWQTITPLLVITFLLGILTGIYPSFYMTSFNMSKVLKGGGKTEGRSIFRSGLVVVQFGLALAMIVSTLVVIQQLSFMKNTDIGFDKDQMMLIKMNKEVNSKFETMKAELLRSSIIQGVTASGQRLGNNFHQWGFKIKADTGVMSITPSNVNVDYDYLKVYGIELKEGRGFSKDFATDNGMAFVINETFAKELGLKEKTVGTRAGHGWYKNDSLGTIIGVVKDFNFNSLHYKVNTLEMVVHPDWGYDEMSVKIQKGKTTEGVELVKSLWDKNITGFPMDYSFLDQHFEVLYQSDKQMGSVVTIMAGLAILISCMGLFALAAITTEKKTKEIGIRKALGASVSQITVLLSRNFAWLIVLSFVIVSPITYYVLYSWLQHFAYRIGINLFVFGLGGILAMAIGLFTIGFHTLRSARANPVKSLRYE
ncbi:ABC transporter permease [Cytophagales bacterium WSM2-2]|nr:ABC transporter permease [Cytophagales bacterium WSM2-2]